MQEIDLFGFGFCYMAALARTAPRGARTVKRDARTERRGAWTVQRGAWTAQRDAWTEQRVMRMHFPIITFEKCIKNRKALKIPTFNRLPDPLFSEFRLLVHSLLIKVGKIRHGCRLSDFYCVCWHHLSETVPRPVLVIIHRTVHKNNGA